MKRYISLILLLVGTISVSASAAESVQENQVVESVTGIDNEDLSGPLNIEIGGRVDYQREYHSSECIDDNCGFKGKFLMLRVKGNITDKISYNYRQRLNELHSDKSFFDGTDYLTIKYRFNRKWDITGGKFAINFGTYEYQRDPMEAYISSEFFTMIPCYRFGAEVGYNINDNHRFTFQFNESPFKKKGMDLYSYSLAWFGNFNNFKTVYSANVLEYQEGKFIYYLGLGHRVEMGKFALELDYINRATGNHTFFFKDCSVIGELSFRPSDHWNTFAKVSYNRNDTDDPADECIVAGTDITQVGGGLEFFPLKNDKSLRIHAAYSYCFGDNANPSGSLQKNQHFMTVGVQWRMDLVKIASDLWNKIRKDKK